MNPIKKTWNWIDERSGYSDYVLPLLKHIVPRDARWWYVFGSATLTAFLVQVLTGICLAMVYVPGGDEAYESLKYITEQAFLGNLLRGMHYYGASAMVMLTVMHMCQVYLHATYKYPRELNWMSGVVLMMVVFGMAFSGQLLRWDDNGVWSVMVAAEMAARAPVVGPWISDFIFGGAVVGGATLTRFFVFHVFIMPAIIFAGIGLHMVFLLRHGVSEMPNPEQPVDPETYKEEYEARLEKTGVPFWPDAMWRDVVFSTFVVAGIVLCAAFLGPPALSTPPDPSNIHSNPMPDWYFWWYFTVLSVLPSSMETWIILGAPVFGFLAVLLVPFISNKGQRAPSKRPWAVGLIVFGATSFVVLTIYGYYKPWSPDFGVDPLPESVIGVSSGPVFEGGQLVHKKGCLYCHHIDGYGGHRGPVLSDIGQKLTREDITIRIMNGGYNMPSFAGSISSEDLSHIVDFLLSRHPTNEKTTE